MTQQPLSNANVGDIVTFKGVVHRVYSTGSIEVTVPVAGDSSLQRSLQISTLGSTLVEDITYTSPRYRLGTVLESSVNRYVVVDEEGQRVAQVFDSHLGCRGTVQKISDISCTLKLPS